VPFKSKAQRRKFAELLVKGKISDETFEEWNRSTGTAALPERVEPKRKPGPGSRSRRTSKPTARTPVQRKSKRKSPGKSAKRTRAK
jgi:hypothetical protein